MVDGNLCIRWFYDSIDMYMQIAFPGPGTGYMSMIIDGDGSMVNADIFHFMMDTSSGVPVVVGSDRASSTTVTPTFDSEQDLMNVAGYRHSSLNLTIINVKRKLVTGDAQDRAFQYKDSYAGWAMSASTDLGQHAHSNFIQGCR